MNPVLKIYGAFILGFVLSQIISYFTYFSFSFQWCKIYSNIFENRNFFPKKFDFNQSTNFFNQLDKNSKFENSKNSKVFCENFENFEKFEKNFEKFEKFEKNSTWILKKLIKSFRLSKNSAAANEIREIIDNLINLKLIKTKFRENFFQKEICPEKKSEKNRISSDHVIRFDHFFLINCTFGKSVDELITILILDFPKKIFHLISSVKKIYPNLRFVVGSDLLYYLENKHICLFFY